jgi:peptidyl-prolyl cis-trans isomerase D
MRKILGDRFKNLMTWMIILLIAVVFVFLGLNDYFSSAHSSVVAKVAGQKITQTDVERLYERLAQQGQESGNEEALKQQALNALIRRAALLSLTHRLGFVDTEQQLAQVLLKIPAFQVDGQFSKEEYLKRLSQSGYSDALFRKEVAEDICLAQLEQGIVHSDFVTPQELNMMVQLSEQKRNVGYVILPAQYGRKEIRIADQALENYYNDNKQNFIAPEQVSLEYVLLSPEMAMKKVSLSPDEIKHYYESHQQDYTLPERVHARHLLIAVKEDDSGLDQKAKARAADLLAQMRGGADFAGLAKLHSEDPGSAPKGGDLGWFSKGQMVPEFEQAAFALKPGAMSELVRSPFGYHIIQLIARKESEVRPLAVVESNIREQLTVQKAQELFEKESSTLEKLAKESGKNLETIASQAALKIESTTLFSREGAEGLLSDPVLLTAVFSEDFLKTGYSQAPLRLSNQALILMRIKQHQAARPQTFAEAKPAIQQVLIEEAAQTRLKTFTENFIKRVAQCANPAELAKEQGLVWQTKTNVSRMAGMERDLLWTAFQVSGFEFAEKQQLKIASCMLRKVRDFKLQDGRHIIISVDKVMPGEWAALNPQMQQEYRRGLAGLAGQMDYMAMMLQVLDHTPVKLIAGSAS